MKLAEKICAADDVVAREVSGEMVLMNLSSGTYFGLNEVGTAVWRALGDAAHELTALCDAVEAEFDAPRDVIEADVAELAAELLDQGLIEIA